MVTNMDSDIRKLEDMTLREKIGQMIVTGFKGTSLPEEYSSLVKEYKIANTIFFSYNCESENQIRELCAAVQQLVRRETGTCAFITIDQEGGTVTRLPEDSFHIPGAMALAQTDEHSAYQAALYTGQRLRELGVNFNLAPVLDINSNSANPVIGVRSFGSSAAQVAKYGCAAVRGYKEAGILCSVKHFPGHGDTAEDSHLCLPCVDKSYEELKKTELVPFREAIKAGAPAVTLAHILFPQIETEKVPATMSHRIIQDILRGDLGFDGLIISDCMEMNAIGEYFGTAAGAVKAVAAGVDLVFISHTAQTAAEAVCRIEAAVLSGELLEKRINEAVERILIWKQNFIEQKFIPAGDDETAKRRAFFAQLLERTVHYTNRENGYRFVLGKAPVFLGCGAYRSTLASGSVDESLQFARYFGKRYGADYLCFTVQPKEAEVRQLIGQVKAKPYSAIVIGTYNGHLNWGQTALVKGLSKLGIPLAAAALRNPYDLEELDDTVAKIAAYEYTIEAFEAIGRLFADDEI